MAYNRDISHPAPLPSGALPTDNELAMSVNRARHERAKAISRSLGWLLRGKPARS